MRYPLALFLALTMSSLARADDVSDLKKMVAAQQAVIAQLQSRLAGLSVEDGTLKLQGKSIAKVEADAMVWKGSPSGLKGDKGDAGTNGSNGTNGANGSDANVCGKAVKIQGNMVTGVPGTFQFNRTNGVTAVTANRAYITNATNSEDFVLICR